MTGIDEKQLNDDICLVCDNWRENGKECCSICFESVLYYIHLVKSDNDPEGWSESEACEALILPFEEVALPSLKQST